MADQVLLVFLSATHSSMNRPAMPSLGYTILYFDRYFSTVSLAEKCRERAQCQRGQAHQRGRRVSAEKASYEVETALATGTCWLGRESQFEVVNVSAKDIFWSNSPASYQRVDSCQHTNCWAIQRKAFSETRGWFLTRRTENDPGWIGSFRTVYDNPMISTFSAPARQTRVSRDMSTWWSEFSIKERYAKQNPTAHVGSTLLPLQSEQWSDKARLHHINVISLSRYGLGLFPSSAKMLLPTTFPLMQLMNWCL